MKHIQLRFLLCLTCLLHTIMYPSIETRPAALDEIPAILELDRKVTYAFFRQLYIDAYHHIGVSQNVDQDIENELVADAQSFHTLACAEGNERLHVAWDTIHNIPCGLLTFHKENEEIILDILMVDADYRGQGIGKQLVLSSFKAWNDIKKITVHPLIYNNENTLKFYGALGFKNLGISPSDKLNMHGIPYSKMYYHYELNLK